VSARRHDGPAVRFDLPADPGTYVLVIRLHWECVIEVGALGDLTFPPGLWLYCGSAMGPGGLAARLAHHAGFSERPRWHMDYLRFAGSPVEVWYDASSASREHDWAAILRGMNGIEPGPRGFGCSDCRCGTHLFRSESEDIFEIFRAAAPGTARAPAVRSRG
jgi:Uri superfamily endonuclease